MCSELDGMPIKAVDVSLFIVQSGQWYLAADLVGQRAGPAHWLHLSFVILSKAQVSLTLNISYSAFFVRNLRWHLLRLPNRI